MMTLMTLMTLGAAEPTLAAASDSDGLTFAEVLGNLPTDPASVFVLLLFAASVGGILWIGRSRGPRVPGSGV